MKNSITPNFDMPKTSTIPAASASRITHLLCLLFPFALWAFLFRDAVFGRIVFHGDNVQYSHWVLYFFDNLQQGVFPVWNPFHSWGCIDNLDMRFIGEYNPLLYIIPLMRSVGSSGQAAFTAFMISYFWVGAAGLYALTYRLFKNPYIACAAYTLLLFSGYGIQFFIFQITDVLITAPLLWFFFFLLSFIQRPRSKYLLGTTLTVMLAATTYIPFIFIVVTGLVLVLMMILYAKQVLPVIKRSLRFFSRRRLLTIFCFISIIYSTVPLVIWRLSSFDPQYIVDVERHASGSQDLSEVSQTAVNSVCLSAMTSPRELFDNLDIADDQVMPFVSVFVYIALLLSALTRMTRRSYILFISFCVLMMLACGDGFPLHPWLFQHIKFFRLFRNYLFFFPILISFAVLFLMDRLEALYHSYPRTLTRKVLTTLWGIACLTGLIIFLRQFDHIILSTYITTAAALLVFFIWIWKKHLSIKTFFLSIILIALVQPLEFFQSIIPLCIDRTYQEHPAKEAQFPLTRPPRGSGFNENHSFHKRYKILRDDSGFSTAGFFGLRYVRDLHENIPAGRLQNYVQTKFYLYSRWDYVTGTETPWAALRETFPDASAPALIFDHPGPMPPEDPAPRMPVTQYSETFQVTDFNVNKVSIILNVPQARLLVYNDTFHKDWRCTIDGRPVKIWRTNYAFKGVMIPAGKHQVTFVFGGTRPHIIFWTLLALTFAVWMITLYSFLKDHDTNKS